MVALDITHIWAAF